MTTYNTYAEAKIANPDSEIYVHGDEFATKESAIQLSVRSYGDWYKCHPKDYCMTLEEFLTKGYKLVNKDLYIDRLGRLVIVGENASASVANDPSETDNICYILRAKALEAQSAKVEIDNTPQQVRSLSSSATTKLATKVPTKVDYLLVEDSIFDLQDDFEKGVLYYRSNKQTKPPYQYEKIKTLHVLCNCASFSNPNIYRRIEKEVDWREELKDFLMSPSKDTSPKREDAGMNFNIGNMREQDYLEMCRVTLRAIGDIE